MNQDIELINDSGEPAVGVILAFKLTRTDLIAVAIQGLPHGATVHASRPSERTFEIRWGPDTVPSGSRLIAQVRYEGEPVTVERIGWEAVTGDGVLRGGNLIAKADAAAASPASLLRRRSEAIRRTPDPVVRRYQEFFLYFDSNTHPGLLQANPDVSPEEARKRLHAIGLLTDTLMKRIYARLRMMRGDMPARKPLPRSRSDTSVDLLSKLQLDIYAKHFTSPSGQFDLEAFEDAFERFANGELRVEDHGDVWNGEPDSAFDFLFGEFGLLAIEMGVEVKRWSVVVPVLVRMQEIFMQVYRPEGPPPYRWNQYTSDNFAPHKQVDQDFKRRLREKYHGMDVAALSQAVSDNLWRAAAKTRLPRPTP